MSRKRNPLVDPDKLGGRMIIAEQRLQAHARRDHALDARITSLSIRLAAVERQNAPEQAETAPEDPFGVPGDYKLFEESFEGVKPVEYATVQPTGDPDLVKQVMGFYQTRPVRDSMPTYTPPRGGVEILPPVTRGSPKPELWRLIERQRIELTRLNKRARRHKKWRVKHQQRLQDALYRSSKSASEIAQLNVALQVAKNGTDRWRYTARVASQQLELQRAENEKLRKQIRGLDQMFAAREEPLDD